jgi:hypothetical protein
VAFSPVGGELGEGEDQPGGAGGVAHYLTQHRVEGEACRQRAQARQRAAADDPRLVLQLTSRVRHIAATRDPSGSMQCLRQASVDVVDGFSRQWPFRLELGI